MKILRSILKNYENYKIKGLLKILIGLLITRINYNVKIKTNEINNLSYSDYLFLFQFIRVTPNKLREYSLIPRKLLVRFEKLLCLKITPNFLVCRKTLFENEKIRKKLFLKVNEWVNLEKDKFISSKIIFLHHYILYGTDSSPPYSYYLENGIDNLIIGNNTAVEKKIKRNIQLATYGQVGCIVMFCNNNDKIFFAHFSTNPFYEKEMFKTFNNWLEKSLSKKQKDKVIINIISYKCNYYVEKLNNLVKRYSAKIKFYKFYKNKTDDFNIKINYKTSGSTDLLYLDNLANSAKSWKEIKLQKYQKLTSN